MKDLEFQFPPCSQEQFGYQGECSKLYGKAVVVKVGGEILLHAGRVNEFARDLIFLRSLGVRLVLCHGGGPQLSEAMKEQGKAPAFVNGHRVTDEHLIELTATVFIGKINRQLTTILNSVAACGIGISGIDGHCIRVRQRHPDLGYVGDVELIRSAFFQSLLEDGLIPVVAPLGVDAAGTPYNVNADMVAAHLAGAIKASALLLTTNVAGILRSKNDPDSVISCIRSENLPELFNKGIITEGMLPKIEAAGIALEAGVEQVRIFNGFSAQAVLRALANRPDSGTVITSA